MTDDYDGWDDAKAIAEYLDRVSPEFLRVYWDEETAQWRCRCRVFREAGKCRHLARYTPTETVNVNPRYL